MVRHQLDDKLDCKHCGTIQMDIPDGATEHTLIHCSNCGACLGEWGELQDDLAKQVGDGHIFELKEGNIVRR